MATPTTSDAAGLKQSQRAHCLHWLANARCDDPLCTLNERQPWLRSLTGWNRDGNPDCMLAYPNTLTLFDLQDIAHHCFELGLTVVVEVSDLAEWREQGGPFHPLLQLEFRRHDAGADELQSHA